MLRADTSLRYLKGVGPRRAESLRKVGLSTLEDFLYVLPFRYEDRRAFARVADLAPFQSETTLDVHVASARLIVTRRPGFTVFQAVLRDATGFVRAVWYNQPYLEKVLRPDRRAVVFGRPGVDRRTGDLVLENPDYELLDDEDTEGIHTRRIVPIYRKLGELTSRMQRTLIHRALEDLDPASLPEVVPYQVARRRRLLPRLEALRRTHFPPADASLEDLDARRSEARLRLAFEEIFLLQLALALRRWRVKGERRGIAYEVTDAMRTRLARVLPFRLTEAQKRVLKEIGADLRSASPMNRLLQGDVGSGKTIVALLTLLVAVENGYQGALLVPTEILAEQHHRNIRRLFAERDADYRIALLTGSVRGLERRKTLDGLEMGRVQIVVGTHALIEENVRFRKLGVVVVDEQHRFGVLQRAALAEKGLTPDVLVMTATPIPRSLALTVYGDLDLSVIDELPPGRRPITTVVRSEEDRERVYQGLRREVESGRQAYVVVPLVEETEKSDLKAATAFARQLQEKVLRGLRVGLLHGRMKGEGKERVMRRFVEGEIQVLVATTVVEVGVDVANATVMVVEHAERFGLSQLHQLRGRVGRGSARSYCVLMAGDLERSREATERLQVMAETHDGFQIAEKDLELRGPGAVFGAEQHGLSDLQFLAVVLRNPDLLEGARKEALALVQGGAPSREAAVRSLVGLRPGWRRRLDLAGVG